MSETVRVDTYEQALAVVALAQMAVQDFTEFWPIMEGQLHRSQLEHWNNRFGIGITHAPVTVKKRRRREGYYGRFAKSGRARPNFPFLEWTGDVRKAASVFAEEAARYAKVIPTRVYRGKTGKTWDQVVLKHIPAERVYNLRDLQKRAAKAMGVWLNKEILPKVAKAAGRI